MKGRVDATVPLILLSGPRGVGKSTICRRLAEALEQRGAKVGGIVTQRQDDRRYAVDLAAGERRLLAAVGEALDGPRYGDYSFSQEALAWGNAVVARAVQSDSDLVVLDEVGPLELHQRKGFQPALQLLPTTPRGGLIVVRSELVQAVRERVARPIAIWSASVENRDQLPSEIAAWLMARLDRYPTLDQTITSP